MSVLSSLADGCQRSLRAPALLAGLWLAYVMAPAPIALHVNDVDMAMLDASAIDPVPALFAARRYGEMATHALLVTFLLGGMMDRLARNRSTSTFGFFGACGMYFFRFLRLDVLAFAIFGVIFLAIYQPAADWPGRRAVLAGSVVLLHILFDYARVRMVVEDRRSAFGALAASARFVRRNAGAVLALTALNIALAGATWWLAATFEIGLTTALYAYLLARALLRLIFMASSISLFQGRLAHAGYVARPIARWPDSPAAEAVLPR